jgi:hypothetical protein
MHNKGLSSRCASVKDVDFVEPQQPSLCCLRSLLFFGKSLARLCLCRVAKSFPFPFSALVDNLLIVGE